ncbi:hypothetical protein HPP92_017585 [Vanilla planifolia]|uniref:Uncharacterized protein n=1 Tax=Vanilla planifolia TaxID=51239 RepID=A0A835QFQ9_VANPL|nr:hypothetical protein HPP92_017585 [Vanilla planifolia]
MTKRRAGKWQAGALLLDLSREADRPTGRGNNPLTLSWLGRRSSPAGSGSLARMVASTAWA